MWGIDRVRLWHLEGPGQTGPALIWQLSGLSRECGWLDQVVKHQCTKRLRLRSRHSDKQRLIVVLFLRKGHDLLLGARRCFLAQPGIRN